MKKEPPIYGLLAEFEQPDDLVAAANRTREEGYRLIDAYTPFPVHGLPEAIVPLPAFEMYSIFVKAAGGRVAARAAPRPRGSWRRSSSGSGRRPR